MSNCPCGSAKSYQACCQPLHQGNKTAQTPTQLMRSRYCAFVMEQIAYIYLTHSPKTRDSVSIDSIAQWNKQCDWRGLDIVTNSVDESSNRVEFIAWYKEDGQLKCHHELSQFSYEDLDPAFQQSLTGSNLPQQVWYYLSASYPEKQVPLPKRNGPCVCNSGKKFKKCCG